MEETLTDNQISSSLDNTMEPGVSPSLSQHSWYLLDLPATSYDEIHRLQKRLVAARSAGTLARDVLIIVEHAPVYTFGRHGGRENLLVDDAFLARKSIDLAQTERGGNVTYHGPGQLILYPIMNLHAARLGVADYVYFCEEIMIRTAADFSVTAVRNEVNHGVWVGPSKLGSVGIAIRRGICFHGLALNVNCNLTPFTWINFCGLAGTVMTSLEQASGTPVSMQTVRRRMRHYFTVIFEVDNMIPLPASLQTSPGPDEANENEL